MPRRKPKVDDRPNQNMGRLQKAEPYWHTWGDDGEGANNYFRGPEWSDRLEREAHGKPLPAAYRYLLGPVPQLLAGDRDGARLYLRRIEQAIEQGGWTRSEARRLRNMRDKWRKRAEGQDARFAEVGNRTGGLAPHETANVQQRRIVEDTREKIMARLRNEGD